MAFVFEDMRRETATITGASNPYSLNGLVVGYGDFDTVMADNDTSIFRASSGADYEVFLGTFTSGSPDTLARTTIIRSSNGNNAVVWGSSTVVDIVMTASATDVLTARAQTFTAAQKAQILANIGVHTHGPAMFNGTIVSSRTSNAETYALKTLAGTNPSAADPVFFVFINSDGTYTVRTVTAATSITIPSTATMGATNATAFRIWITAHDTGSGVELGVFNAKIGTAGFSCPPPGAGLSTIAISTASDSAGVYYTTNTQTTKQWRWIAYASYESGLATAGTWVTAPDNIVLTAPHVRPGVVLQGVSATAAFGSTTTSGSYVDVTGASITLQPSSKNNLLKLSSAWFGSVTAGGAATNSNYYAAWTGGSIPGNFAAVGVVSASGTNMQSEGTCAVNATWCPASIASLTIKLQHYRTTGGTATATTSSGNAYIEEILV